MGMGNGMLVKYLFMDYRASVIFLTVNRCGFDKTVTFTLGRRKKKSIVRCVLLTQRSQPESEADEQAALLVRLLLLPVRWRNGLIPG